jgi:DNA-binding NarL/FixJ family response regulator
VESGPEQPKIAKVLVADDHQEIRELLSLVLESHAGTLRFSVAGRAQDGQEAVEMARESRPDAIILDLSMPRMDGLDAAQILRSEHPKMVILIYSGFEASEFAATARQCGADASVEKSAGGLKAVVAQLEALLQRDESGDSIRP